MPDLFDQPSAPLRRLGGQLRELRLTADLGQGELARRLSIAQPQVSRIENARRIPSVEVIGAWFDACAARCQPGVQRETLVELREAAASERIGWHTVHEGGLERDQRSYAAMERQALGIRVFQCSVVPGQLQIGAYAREVLRLSTEASAEDIAAGVRARLDRQMILHEPPPEGCRFVITEAALRWRPVGDDHGRLQVAQLDRLLAVLDLPGVDLRILPWHDPQAATHLHPFVHLVMSPEPGEEEPAGVVIVETLDGERVIRAADQLMVYREYYDRLAAVARSGPAAREVITRVMREVQDAAFS